MGKDWQMLSFQMLDVISGGPYVVAYGRVEFRNRHTDKVFASPKADVFRFAGDQIVEFIEYYDTAGAVRAACTRLDHGAVLPAARPERFELGQALLVVLADDGVEIEKHAHPPLKRILQRRIEAPGDLRAASASGARSK